MRLAWRIDVTNLIKSDAGAGQSPGRRFRLADGLIVGQVAICLVALTGASLFLRTLQHAKASDPMFRAGNALLATVDLLSAGYDEPRGKNFLRDLLSSVRQLSGIEAAAYLKIVPLGGFRGTRDVRVNGIDANVHVNTVSAGYFRAAGLPILRGRDLRDGETASMIINEQMAERFWPGADPVGKIVGVQGKLKLAVVGVVRDGRMRNFREPKVAPCLYLPLEADYQRLITLYVRTASHPLAAASAVRAAMQELDRSLPFEAVTLETYLNTALGRERLAASMLTGLATFTILLAAIGLYGLISVAVSQRSREIGIRMALGARRERAVGTVIKRFAWLLGAGLIVGLLAAAGLARFVEALVFGIQPIDPVALGTACFFLAAVAIVASAIPAMRAAFTDPMSVLRQD